MSVAAPTPVPLSRVVARLQADGLLLSAPAAEPLLSGISDDSRRVSAGDLFCAWAGTSSDAHAFVPGAAASGAAAALVERVLPEVELPQLLVSDGRRAAAAAAMVVLGDPAGQLQLVAVTGTNGKSTTVWMLRWILSTRAPAGSIGTLGVRRADGSIVPGTAELTTPGPVDLARTLRDFVDAGVRYVAMEASSHALDQGRVAALRFDTAVYTNLTRDHLDYHGTLEAYRAAKLLLLDLLRPNATVVVNADDPAWDGIEVRAPHGLRFSRRDRSAQVRAEGVQLNARGARFRLLTPEGVADARIPLVGDYNVDNALGATAAAHALGVPLGSIVERLATVPQVPGRLEKLTEEPCAVFADYAHTPDALQRALSALRPLARGRLIVLFGAGGDRDRGKRPLMAAAAEAGADLVVATSDNPRTERPDAILDEIATGFTRPGWVRITDRRAAIGWALEEAHPGDMILLAGKGHETYQIVGTEKRHFDEREVVADWLAVHGRSSGSGAGREGEEVNA